MTGTPYEGWFTPEERRRFDEIRPIRDARRSNPDPRLWREFGFGSYDAAVWWFRQRGFCRPVGAVWVIPTLQDGCGEAYDWKEPLRSTCRSQKWVWDWRPKRRWVE